MPAGRKRPAPFLAFSSFARTLIFSTRAAAASSGLSKPLRLPDDATTSAAGTSGQDSMPRPPSKRAEPSNDQDRSSSSESEEESFSNSESDAQDGEESSEGELQTVQADFAFFDPKPSDFHGARLLLKTYLDSKPWDLTGFIDLILAQTTVGTIVKLADDDEEEEEGEGTAGDKTGAGANDDDDLFGLISVLNLGRYAEHRCIKDLKEYLLAVCSDKDTKKQLKSLLEEKASSVGLMVCRRFVNFPYELVPKLYDALFDEVSWATEDEPTQELRDSFRFKHYLLIVRMLERKIPAKHKAKNSKDDDEPIIYPKLEDEIFNELSSWSFTFPIRSEQSPQQETKNYKEMGLVMAVKAEAIPKFRKKLEALVSE